MRFLLRYLKYRFRSVDEHSVHSPFLFKLLTEVIYDNSYSPACDEIELLRRSLLHSEEEIEVEDLGAGSRTGKNKKRRIAEIMKNAGHPVRYGRLLYRLSKRIKAKSILELGTSLGISALYQHAGNPDATLTTLEGCKHTAAYARNNFAALHAEKIKLVEGNFNFTLPDFIRSCDRLDQVFFDGNHRREPTLSYFRACLQKAHEGSVFIFDDIHWSDEMESAWEEIRTDPAVSLSIDLFYMGLVFFHKGQARQHFILKFKLPRNAYL